MKKFYKITALLLSVIICLGMLSVGSFAATMDLDFKDGYVVAYDKNDELFGGVYEVGQAFEYHVRLMIWDKISEEYVPVPDEESDVLALYDALEAEETVIATATGDTISWTANEAGYHNVEIRLTRDGQVYYGNEIYQIGEPWDMQYAQLHYENYPLSEGEEFIYDNTSIANGLKVYFYPAGEYLVAGEDYTMKVSNAKGPGKATVTVTGKGKCVGTLKLNVKITSPSAQFGDVDQKGWYVASVNYVLTAGLFNGTSKTTFEPHTAMTRGMFVTVAIRLLGLDEADEMPPLNFVDVPKKQYYAKAVAWANYLGIVNGVDATHFAPNQKITREQMCAMILRLNDVVDVAYDEMMGEDVKLEMKAGGEKFADHKKIASYAREAVYACRNEGVVNGKPGNLFDPKGNATRAEVATVLLNYSLFISEHTIVA